MVGIIYFSGTGNSRWAVETCLELVSEQEIKVKCLSVEEGEDRVRELFESSHRLIIVYPIYGSDMPRLLKKTLLKLSSRIPKKTMLLCTQLSFSGDANIHMAKLLRKGGMDVVVTGELNMSNNLCTPLFKRKPMIGEELHENLRVNRERLDVLVQTFLAEKNGIKRLTFNDFIGGGAQRLLFNLCYPLYHLLLSTNERCTRCGYCEKICPVKAITVSTRKVRWSSRCIFCVRCYNYCPVEGIDIMRATEDRDRFRRYKGPESSCSYAEDPTPVD